MTDLPKNLASLFSSPAAVREAFEFLAALKNAKILTESGEVALKWAPGAANVMWDLRPPTATGETDPNAIPAQTGNAGRYLQTNGAVTSWAPALTYYTEMRRVSAQSTVNNTGTPVSWDTTVENAFGLWTLSAPTLFTIPAGKAGVWVLSGYITYAASASGTRQGSLILNGTTGLASTALPPVTVSANLTAFSVATVAKLAAGDAVTLRGWQTSGGALDIANARLAAYRLGD